MTNATDTDLAELKELIVSSQKTIETGQKALETRLSAIEGKIETISKDIVDLKVGQAKLNGDIKTLEGTLKGDIKTLEGTLKGEIKALSEKTDSLNKRLETSEFINRGVFIVLLVTLLGGLARFLWSPPA
jgi:chromosome segregation ATPase